MTFNYKDEKLLNDMAKDIIYIRRDVDKIIAQLDKDYVTKDQFEPIRKIVYGLVGTILIAFLGAVIAVVIK